MLAVIVNGNLNVKTYQWTVVDYSVLQKSVPGAADPAWSVGAWQ